MGRESKVRGENWEQQIERETSFVEGVTLFKVPTAQTHKGKRKYTRKSYVDFSGHTADGRHIAIEAKCVKDPKAFYLKRHLKDFQLEVLTAAGATRKRWESFDGDLMYTGAISFVFLCVQWWERRKEGQALVERFILPVDGEGRVAGLENRAPFHFKDANDAYKLAHNETWIDGWERLEREGLA